MNISRASLKLAFWNLIYQITHLALWYATILFTRNFIFFISILLFHFQVTWKTFPYWLVGWLVLLFLFRPERNLQQGREITYLKVLIKSATHCDDSTKFLSFKTSLIKFYMEARRKKNYLENETKVEKWKIIKVQLDLL